MDHQEAEAFVRRMFNAHGRNANDGTIAEYAEPLVGASCEPCAVLVIERLRTEGVLEDESRSRRFPTAPEIRAAISRSSLSVAHGHHAGRTAKEDSVGDLEGWWHRSVVPLVRRRLAAGDPPELASYITACMWWSGLPATLSWVDEEIADPTFETVWLATSRAFMATRSAAGTAPRELADRAWLRVRRAALGGEESLPVWLVDLEAAPA